MNAQPASVAQTAVRGGRGCRFAGHLSARAPAGAAAWPDRGHRRRQGGGRDGARGRRPLAGRRCRGWSSPATATACRASTSRSSRQRIRCPMPPAEQAARRMLELVQGLGAGRSGAVPDLRRRLGAAALPAPGLTLEDKQAVNRALLRSGANIGEMNCVRKHLSAIKGGRLAAACAPARVVTLLISDVPGDDPAVIASGPTVPTRPAAPMRWRSWRSTASTRHRPVAASTCARRRDETPKPGDPRLGRCELVMLTHAAGIACEAAADGRASSRHPAGHPGRRDRGRGARRRAGACRHRAPGRAPRPTVRARPACCSPAARPRSRCAARAAAGAMPSFCWRWPSRCDGHPGIYALAGDTDGIDGTEDNAGAILTPDTLERARRAGLRSPRPSSPTTTATASSRPSATWSSPARP